MLALRVSLAMMRATADTIRFTKTLKHLCCINDATARSKAKGEGERVQRVFNDELR